MPCTGTASLPLHGGKAPRWLFGRMVKLAESIADVMVYEYGQNQFLHMLSDPFWFQALSCILGFDWHSSGTTTVTCGALKEALNSRHGLLMIGGKGTRFRNIPDEIEDIGNKFNLHSEFVQTISYASHLTVKVDNAAVQDGYQLYHHVVFVSEQGDWSVIQQGMNTTLKYARRYHWISNQMTDFVCEPHTSVVGSKGTTLNLIAHESSAVRDTSVDLVNDGPRHLRHDMALLALPAEQTTLDGRRIEKSSHLRMPRTINWQALQRIYDIQPNNYEELLVIRGVGPATIRALAYVAELVYGAQTSWKDPIKFSFAVGGKDGVPYPVNRKAMDKATEIIKQGILEARLRKSHRLQAIKRLKSLVPP